MTTAGITMVRDEADIIEHTLWHMATQVDFLYVSDNRSVDGTSDILEDLRRKLPVPLTIQRDETVAYEQSKKMTALAQWATFETRCDWIVPFDADEIWYSQNGSISRFLDGFHNMHIVEASLFDHVATSLDQPTDTNPVSRMMWRRGFAAPLPKVAVRSHSSLRIGMGNHDASYKVEARTSGHRLAIRHFPYRSPEQVVQKIRNGAEAYKASELPKHYGAHWRGWGRILDEQGEQAIVDLFHKWHWRQDPQVHIDIDGDYSPPLRFDPACDVTSIC